MHTEGIVALCRHSPIQTWHRIVYGFLAVLFVHAQEEGRIRQKQALAPQPVYVFGRVIDGRSGEPLPGAVIQLGSQGAVTDAKGFFRVAYTQSGDTLYARYVEYRPKGIVLSRPGEVVVALEPLEVELESVEIVAEMDKATEGAVALERLRSLEFGEVYTAERIMRQTTDFYVPNVLRRLPGLTLLSGRWVSVRGLSERYNAFAFWAAYPGWLQYDASMPAVNEIVSTLLGRVEVRKIWTPELLGHFGGGMIDFQLPEGGEEGFVVAMTGEFGSYGLGQRYPTMRGNWKKWDNLNLGDPAPLQASAPGGRPLPENFTYARQYQRLTVPDTGTFAPPGPLLTLSYARTKGRLQAALRFIHGQRYTQSRVRFSDGTFDSTDGAWYYTEYLSASVRPIWNLNRTTGLSASFTYSLSARHRLALSLLGVDYAAQKHTLEQGTYYNDDLASYLTSWYATTLLERSRIGVGRLRYQYLGSSWRFALEAGSIGQQYLIPHTGAMNYAIHPGDSALLYETVSWGYGEVYALSWHSQAWSGQGYVHPYVERRWGGPDTWLSIRLGAWYSAERQSNQARRLGLMPDTTQPSILTPEVLAIENISQVYAEANRIPGGFYLLDRTSDYDRWQGLTVIGAGYGMARLGYGRWETMAGLRYELFDRQLKNLPVGGRDYQTFLTERRGDILPATIVKYRLSAESFLKGAVYHTLIRPPVPAQVPVRYFDYFFALYWGGDPSYRTGSAWNADLRYERVKGPYRLLAVGLFYKTFRNLPEIYLEPASYAEVLVFKTRNRPYGQVSGVEVEVREILWGDEASPRLWSYLNATLSESGGNILRSLRDPYNERLQGQAPYVVNVGLIGRPTQKWEVSTFLNYTGPQIWAVGFDRNVYPNILERGRTFWEWQVVRRLGRWELRASVWDVLNQPYRRIQRVGNENRPFNPDQDAMSVYQRDEWRFYLTVRYRVW